MFVAINYLNVPGEYASRLEEAFKGSRRMHGVPGFISYDLLRAEEGGQYLVVTKWEDKAAFESWRESDAFEKAHSSANSRSPVTSELRAYDIVMSQP